jgi:hypothetical protein
MTKTTEQLQEELIAKLEKVSDKKFIAFAFEWLGIDKLWEETEESIEQYDDVKGLENAIKSLKK